MKKHLVLIKMGGSLITDKAKPLTFRKDHIRRIANEVGELQKDNIDFLVGTGAGSFGHFSAHKYRLRDGAFDADQFYGMCVTHNATQRLSGLVADEFIKENIAAFTLSPSSMISYEKGAAVDVNVIPIHNLLDKSVIPIVHGDTILDTVRGTVILSTEKVFHVYLEHLRPSYEKISLIYLLDGDGILDKKGELLAQFTPKDKLHIRASHAHDVTGGIEGKVKSAREALQYADEVYLLNGMKPGLIKQALDGKGGGTRVIG